MRAVILNGGVWLSHANGNDDELQRQRRQYGELEKRIYRTSKTGKEEGGRGRARKREKLNPMPERQRTRKAVAHLTQPLRRPPPLRRRRKRGNYGLIKRL